MLVSQPDMVQEQLVRAFPFLIEKAPFSSFQQTAFLSDDANDALNGLRPVTTERIDGWRSHLSRIKEQLAQHADLPDLLINNGYERDTQWLRMLEGVESRHHKTWQDSGVHFLKRIDRWQRRERKVMRYMQLAKKRLAHGSAQAIQSGHCDAKQNYPQYGSHVPNLVQGAPQFDSTPS